MTLVLQQKQCRRCKEFLNVSEFGIHNCRPDKLRDWCNECSRASRRKYGNSKRGREKDKIWKRNNPEKVKKYNKIADIRRKFGLEIEQYNDLVQSQNGLCAICNQPETAINQYGKVPLSIDHNHITGKVRGLLCFRCNAAIGGLRVDEFGKDLLLKTIDYLGE